MNAKVGRESFYYPTIGNNSLHEICNDNGERLVKFAASKDMVIGGTCFKHKDINKATWVAPDGRTANQIDHLLIDKRHFSNLLDIRSRRAANVYSDHYLVTDKIRARIANINKTYGNTIKTKKYNIENLKQENVASEYITKLEENLQRPDNDEINESIDERWKHCKTAIIKTAEE